MIDGNRELQINFHEKISCSRRKEFLTDAKIAHFTSHTQLRVGSKGLRRLSVISEVFG
jgi:hypothetical protein